MPPLWMLPRQRNSREENKQVKNGETPEEWKKNPYKLAQKGTDARWTKKNNETHYGYKDHVKVDAYNICLSFGEKLSTGKRQAKK